MSHSYTARQVIGLSNHTSSIRYAHATAKIIATAAMLISENKAFFIILRRFAALRALLI